MADVVLILSIVVIGLLGGYILLQVIFNLNSLSGADLFFGAWVFDPNRLNNKGKKYRRALFIYWLIVIFIIIVFELI